MRELYNESKREEQALNRLDDKNISDSNKQLLKDFVRDYGTLNNLSKSRKAKYFSSFANVIVWFGKELNNPQEKDFIKLIDKIRSLDRSEPTKREYVIMLKTFYKWYQKKFKKELTEENRDALDWLQEYTYKINKNKLKQIEVLTEEEAKRLLHFANSTRDKCYIAMLYELGVRVGEILNLQLKDIKPYEHGYMINITVSKTQKRKVPVIQSSPYLQTLLNEHPYRDNRNAHLFLNSKTSNDGVYEPINYPAIRKMLIVTVKKAKINKRVWSHLFRHTSATNRSKQNWNTSVMEKYYGWAPGTKQTAVYSHLTDDDAVTMAEESAGIIKQEKKINETLKPVTCNNCKTINEATNMYCKGCSKQLVYTEGERRTTKEDVAIMVKEILKDYNKDKE